MLLASDKIRIKKWMDLPSIQCLEVISLPEAASEKLVVTQGKGVVESVLKSDKHRKKRASNDPVPMGSGFKEVGLGKSLSL